MSQADQLFAENCRDILTNGVWDTGQEIRPRWEDGAPAHAVKKFCVINRYDLQAEFPLLTLRRTYWKTAVKELLWIWQRGCWPTPAGPACGPCCGRRGWTQARRPPR